jgi:hypothetical protein
MLAPTGIASKQLNEDTHNLLISMLVRLFISLAGILLRTVWLPGRSNLRCLQLQLRVKTLEYAL